MVAHRSIFRVALLVAVLTLTGCASSGAFHAGNLTDVTLSEANYEVIATNVTGEASAGYLLGVSAGLYQTMQTVAVARVDGSGMLYGDAMANLWDNFRAQHGPTEGRQLALVNVRFDSDALNLLIYTRPTVAIRADVVEFTD